MKILISGGHLSPSLAVIEALPDTDEIVFVGRKYTFESDKGLSLEFREISKRKIPFYDLKTGKFHRSFSHKGFLSLLRLPKGFYSAVSIIRKEKPDVVVSFGGYIGLPLVYAATMFGIPTVIHEQTLEAGFSNKLSSRVATNICISWQQSARFFPPQKTILTGNPLRKEILHILHTKQKERSLPMIYVTGGSSGSHEVNLIIKQHLEELLESYNIVHQTGDAKEFNDVDELTKLVSSFPSQKRERYTFYKFTTAKEAALLMAQADLVIGRSGINTISELLYLQKKSLLIPLRHGQIGEQMTNAKFLKNLGLSEIFEYSNDFVSQIHMMIRSEEYKLKKPFDNNLFIQSALKIVQVIHETSQTTKI